MAPSMDWRGRTGVIDRMPWERNWDNRARYEHPYSARPDYYRPVSAAERTTSATTAINVANGNQAGVS